MRYREVRFALMLFCCFYYFPLLIVIIAGLRDGLFYSIGRWSMAAAALCSDFDEILKPIPNAILAGLIALLAYKERLGFRIVRREPWIASLFGIALIVSLVSHGLIQAANRHTVIIKEVLMPIVMSTRDYMREAITLFAVLIGFGMRSIPVDDDLPRT